MVVSKFSLFSNIWCGVTSLVIGKLFSLASLIKSTHFFEDKCCAWYLVPYLATSSISLSSTSDSSASSIVIKVSSSFGAAISPGSEWQLLSQCWNIAAFRELINLNASSAKLLSISDLPSSEKIKTPFSINSL